MMHDQQNNKCCYVTLCAFFPVQMSSLKWLGVWGMVGNVSPPTKEDLNKWSKTIGNVFKDPKGRAYFEQSTDVRPPGECTHFQHFTIRPITCQFK
jgi:hypothetical protein